MVVGGIYILESQVRDKVRLGHQFQHEYRVTYTVAIHAVEENPDYHGFNSANLYDYFNQSTVHDNRESAVREAIKMEKMLRNDAIPLNDEIRFINLSARFPLLTVA